MSSHPLVSIISVNWNNPKVTAEMVESLSHITYPNFELIVVDNGSTKGNINSVKDQYPWIKLIKTGKNLGFAGGTNAGIVASKGEYLLFLNNDTEVELDFLEPLVEQFLTVPDTGISTPKILYHEPKGVIQFAGAEPTFPSVNRVKMVGQNEVDKGKYNDTRRSLFAHGACMLVSRKIIEEVGMLPELYFLYFEEFDFCHKVRDAGYTIYYVGKSCIHHKESVSTGKASPLKLYYLTRNRLLFLRRNEKGLAYLLGLAYFLGVAIPKDYLLHLLQGKRKHAKNVRKAVFWHLKKQSIHHTPQLNKRETIS